jgi:hypothetical protein
MCVSVFARAGALWLLIAAAPVRAEPSQHADYDALGLTLGLRMEHGNLRSFRQHEPATGEVRRYDARVYGGVGVSLGFERSLVGELSWSVGADYWQSLIFTSGARRLGVPVDTTAQRFSALAALTLHPLNSSGATAGVHAGIGVMRFGFELPEAKSRDDEEMELATGDYDYASAGVSGRIPLALLGLTLRGSYLLGFHTGDFGARAVDEQPHGFDGLAVLDFPVLPWLELSLRAGMTVLAFKLVPLTTREEAGSAAVRDRYFTFAVGARARF